MSVLSVEEKGSFLVRRKSIRRGRIGGLEHALHSCQGPDDCLSGGSLFRCQTKPTFRSKNVSLLISVLLSTHCYIDYRYGFCITLQVGIIMYV